MTLRFATAIAIAALSASPAAAQLFVDAAAAGPGDGSLAHPYPTIQAALDAPGSSEISVAPGTYVESLFVSGFVNITSQGGPLVTTLQASDPSFALTANTAIPFGGSIRITGFTVTGATAPTGAALIAPLHWHIDVERCLVTGNTAGGRNGYDLFFYESTIAGNAIGVEFEADVAISLMNSTILAHNGVDFDSGGLPLSPFTVGFDYCVGLETDPSLAALGDGNVVGDPGLWNLAGGDLQLAPGSVCIDGGDPGDPNDPDGSTIDVGALTYDASYAPGPNVFCTSKLSSAGCLPHIGASGTASMSSPAEFLVTLSEVPDFKNGLFYFGFGQAPFPFQGGWFCVLPPTLRTALQSSGSTGAGPCTGAFAFDFNAFAQSGAFPFVQAGSLVYGQYWYRAPGDPFGSARTDAVEFGVAP